MAFFGESKLERELQQENDGLRQEIETLRQELQNTKDNAFEAQAIRLTAEANTLRHQIGERDNTIKILRNNNADIKTARDGYKQQLGQQSTVNEALETEIQNLRTTISTGREKNRELRQTIEALNNENRVLKKQTETLTEENEKINKQNAELSKNDNQVILLTQEMYRPKIESLIASVEDQWAENSRLSQKIRILESTNPDLALQQEYKTHTEITEKLAQAEKEIAELINRLKNCIATSRKKTKKTRQQQADSGKL
jgi:chromosome segregation ATPase